MADGREVNNLQISRASAVTVAKLMYEIEGVSLPKIATNVGVSLNCVKKWKNKDNWLAKGVKAPEVAELTRQRFTNMLAEAGMPPEKAAALLVAGMTTPMKDQVIEPDTNKKTGKTTMKTLSEGVPDHGIRHKYHHDYMLAVGMIGNNSSLQVNNQGTGSVNVQVNLPAKGEDE